MAEAPEPEASEPAQGWQEDEVYAGAHIDRAGRTWLVNIRWTVISGRKEPTQVVVASPGGVQAITGEVLRALPLGSIITQARRVHAVTYSTLATDERRLGDPAAAEFYGEREEQFGPRRGVRLSAADLAVVADAYTAAWRDGRRLVDAVATACFISPSAAKKRIRAARDVGLLPPKDAM